MTETTEAHAAVAHAAVVEVRGLVKRYGDEGRRRAEGNVTLALDHVGFSVGAGEFLGLMGRAGRESPRCSTALPPSMRPRRDRSWWAAGR